MINVFRAELFKLTRPRIVAGTFIAVILAAVVATLVVFLAAPDGPERAGRVASLQELARSDGGTEAFAVGMSFSGVFVFVVLAANWALEFSQGTFRTLLMSRPQRPQLMLGKLAGLIAFSAVVLVLFEACTWALSLAVAPTQDVPVSEWFSMGALGHGLTDYGNALIWVSSWTTFGMTVGVLLRSTPLALGVGIAWAGPFEHLTQNAWDVSSRIYPGLLLESVAVGGTPDAPYGQALALLGGYVGLALVVSAVTFSRRDVAG